MLVTLTCYAANPLKATCELLLTDKAKSVDPRLLESVTGIERLGGKGGWFTAISPFTQDGKPALFYVLRNLPVQADLSSNVFLLRVEHTRKLLKKIMQSGTPIILGTIPEISQVEAAALGPGVKFAADALAAAKVTTHKSVILLQSTASKYVLMHEYQHWLDFEDPEFEKQLYGDLKNFFEAKYLTNEEKNWMVRIIWELRGHVAQQLSARRDLVQGLPYLNRVGTIESRDLASSYDFEATQAVSIFNQTYASGLYSIMSKIKAHSKADFDRLVDQLSKYDFSNDPNNAITFKDVLKIGRPR